MTPTKTPFRIFMSWCFYSLIVPLLPVSLGIFIAFLQLRDIERTELLGGTELFLISLTVWTSTKNDLDNSEIDFQRSNFYWFVSRIFLVAMIVLTGLGFAVVYIQERIIDLQLDLVRVVDTGIITAFGTSAIAVLIQLLIAAVSSKQITAEKQDQTP